MLNSQAFDKPRRQSTHQKLRSALDKQKRKIADWRQSKNPHSPAFELSGMDNATAADYLHDLHTSPQQHSTRDLHSHFNVR
jgi:hypothetical protein